MSFPGLFSQVCKLDNLRSAWYSVDESNGCAGIDGVTLDRFASRLDKELKRLQYELENDDYEPLPLVRFFVPKTNGGQRALSVPVVRDRVAEHAVISIVEPLFEAEFDDSSYAYRRGRSVQQALKEIEMLRDAGFSWVVEADIRAFFDNVDHKLLFSRV